MQDEAEFDAELDEAEGRAVIARRQRLGMHPAMPLQEGVPYIATLDPDMPPMFTEPDGAYYNDDTDSD